MDSKVLPEIKYHNMIEYLRSSGCCTTCCVRLIGTGTTDYLNATFEGVSVGDNIPCIACLGILQYNIQQQTLKQIVDSVNSSGFDSSTFTCALSIPASLSLRERFLQISLAHKFNLPENQLCDWKYRTQNIKEVWKTQMLPMLSNAIFKQQTSGSMPSLFCIDIQYNHANDAGDCRNFIENCETNIKLRSHKYNDNINSRNNIEKLLNQLEDREFMKYFTLSSSDSSEHVTIGKISCSHRSIFIGGRYQKLSRHLSQTPWFVNGQKKMETSVQDLLCNYIVKYTHSDTLKFISSGREDVDVRTINEGRPFAVELLNPKVTNISAEKLREIVEKINVSTKLVKITTSLRMLCSTDLQRLKEGENIKTKCYRALCILRHRSKDTVNLRMLDKMKNIQIIQKTPIRVLHRRPLTPRLRSVHEMRARWLTIQEMQQAQKLLNESRLDNNILNNLFVFDVKTQAGTYIKEYVHGDFGRTQPSLCDVLDAEIDIVALDVTAINIDWP